jgi:hypothetical protein
MESMSIFFVCEGVFYRSIHSHDKGLKRNDPLLADRLINSSAFFPVRRPSNSHRAYPLFPQRNDLNLRALHGVYYSGQELEVRAMWA